jgi:hypothetical protein
MNSKDSFEMLNNNNKGGKTESITTEATASTETLEGPVTSVAELLAIEEVIDAMDSIPGVDLGASAPMAKAMDFINAHPELLDTPWLRVDGTIYVVLKNMRDARDDKLAEQDSKPQVAMSNGSLRVDLPDNQRAA